MKKFMGTIVALLVSFNVYAADIHAENLNLSDEQNQKLREMKDKLKAEIQPILEEIQNNRDKITEIEKRYFEELWNMLTEEQRAKFAELNQ